MGIKIVGQVSGLIMLFWACACFVLAPFAVYDREYVALRYLFVLGLTLFVLGVALAVLMSL